MPACMAHAGAFSSAAWIAPLLRRRGAISPGSQSRLRGCAELDRVSSASSSTTGAGMHQWLRSLVGFQW